MNQEIASEISEGIKRKIGMAYKCPICQHTKLAILPGMFVNVLHEDDIDPLKFGPGLIPLVPIMCEHCGYVSQHSLRCLVDDWEKVCKLLNAEDYKK